MAMTNQELQKTANEVRKSIITALHAAGAGHPGGSLSSTDIFTYLYFEEMNVDPKKVSDPDRDRFVLSKGHCAPGLYSVMAEKGYFPKEELTTLRKLGSRLQGHPSMQYLPGLDMSSGSLGQGISLGSDNSGFTGALIKADNLFWGYGIELFYFNPSRYDLNISTPGGYILNKQERRYHVYGAALDNKTPDGRWQLYHFIQHSGDLSTNGGSAININLENRTFTGIR